jgi:hypothetical protein
MNTVLHPTGRSPSFTYITVMTILSPTTWWPRAVAFARYPSAQHAHWLSSVRLRPSGAGSSSAPGRIAFVTLRTGHSPPIAPHVTSRRRSYHWCQAGERMPGKDFHLPGDVRFEAHSRPAHGAGRRCTHVLEMRFAAPPPPQRGCRVGGPGSNRSLKQHVSGRSLDLKVTKSC